MRIRTLISFLPWLVAAVPVHAIVVGGVDFRQTENGAKVYRILSSTEIAVIPDEVRFEDESMRKVTDWDTDAFKEASSLRTLVINATEIDMKKSGMTALYYSYDPAYTPNLKYLVYGGNSDIGVKSDAQVEYHGGSSWFREINANYYPCKDFFARVEFDGVCFTNDNPVMVYGNLDSSTVQELLGQRESIISTAKHKYVKAGSIDLYKSKSENLGHAGGLPRDSWDYQSSDIIMAPYSGCEPAGTLWMPYSMEIILPKDLTVGHSYPLSVDYAEANPVFLDTDWQSSNPEVMTVDENGLLTVLAEGEAVITATNRAWGTSGSRWAKASVIKPSSISVAKEMFILPAGAKYTPSFTYFPEGCTETPITLSCESGDIITNGTELTVAGEEGKEYAVTATTDGAEPITFTVHVCAEPQFDSIIAETGKDWITPGVPTQLNYTVKNADGYVENQEVIWKVDNSWDPDIELSDNGVVTASTWFRVSVQSYGDSQNIIRQSFYSYTIPTEINIVSPESTEINTGKTSSFKIDYNGSCALLDITVSDSDVISIKWKDYVNTVDVLGKNPGTAVVKVSSEKAQAEIEFTVTLGEERQGQPWNPEITPDVSHITLSDHNQVIPMSSQWSYQYHGDTKHCPGVGVINLLYNDDASALRDFYSDPDGKWEAEPTGIVRLGQQYHYEWYYSPNTGDNYVEYHYGYSRGVLVYPESDGTSSLTYYPPFDDISPVTCQVEVVTNEDFEFNGLKMRTIKPDNCQVTGFASEPAAHLVIPSEATYNGKLYKVTEIGSNAFSQDLEQLDLPESIVRLKEHAFTGFIDRINVLGSEPANWEALNPDGTYQLTDEAFSASTKSAADLYVPSDCVKAYQKHPQWALFRNISAGTWADVNGITAPGDKYEVYTLQGTLAGYGTEGLTPGLYIVYRNGKATKVTVK